MSFANHPGHLRTERRKAKLMELVSAGSTIIDALRHPDIGVTYSAYQQWRARDRAFAARMDHVRAQGRDADAEWNGSHEDFALQYFGMRYAPFHLEFISEFEHMELGDVLLALWPPEHGKTSMFENYANEKLATHPQWRFTVASENLTIAQKISMRVKNRMEPDGGAPRYVRDWGPFRPPEHNRGVAQPWAATMWNVYKKRDGDERDYSMMAIGRGSSIVSTRCDHLHVDDIQSTKTYKRSNEIMAWFRQDALSRPGERGITTVVGTRVGPNDFYRKLLDDPDLGDFIRVVRFPAWRRNALTGEEGWLWPERYSERNYARMKIKAGRDAWARNYMQQDGDPKEAKTFPFEMIDRCKDPARRLDGTLSSGGVGYIGVDPGFGRNVVVLCESTYDEALRRPQLIVRDIQVDVEFRRNSQIIGRVGEVIGKANVTGAVTDVIWETMNFQAGLARDETLEELAAFHGFNNREHLTGANKYDPNVGVPSMAESFRRREVVLPWGDDERTRELVGELRKELNNWKPYERGSDLVQDMVMALWFVWIFWQQRRKRPTKSQNEHNGWRRANPPWSRRRSGLLVPAGGRR